jgi:hypothetical protein
MPPFTIFKPTTAIGALFGAAIAFLCFVMGAALLYKGLITDTGVSQVWPLIGGVSFLILGTTFAYWAWGCGSMRYVIDRNAMTIRWGGVQQVIPIGAIDRLIPAAEDEEVKLEGVNWLGHHVGKADVIDFGPVLFYSTHRAMSDVLYVCTPAQTYAISVPDPESFAAAVQSNQTRGALFEQRQVVHREGIASQTFWQDWTALFLAAVLLGAFFVTLGYVLNMYPGLEQTVSLRFPSFAGIVRVTDKEALLDIPRSAAGFAALNLIGAIVLHSWEKMVAYVLLLAGIVLQMVLLVGAIVAVA